MANWLAYLGSTRRVVITSVLLNGMGNSMSEAQFGGYTKNGGFTENVLSQAPITSPISYWTCCHRCRSADLCWHHHLQGHQETEANPGEWVAISGVGGLGHLGAKYAKSNGLLVCASILTTANSPTPSALAPISR